MLKRSRYTEEELNSGQMQYGYDEHVREKTKLVESIFKPVGTLNFKYKTLRESDYNLYSSLDKVITKKIKTYYVPDMERTHKVIINGNVDEKYDITSIDPDAELRFLYIYLERIPG